VCGAANLEFLGMLYGRDPSEVERTEKWMMGVGAALSLIMGAGLVVLAAIKAGGH
jgi:hypothetical protein